MSTVSPVTSASSGTLAPSAGERAKLSREEFMKILISEISNQDPLKPLDHNEFLGQLSTLQNLEATSALTDGITNLSRFQEMGAASAMIGRVVFAADEDGHPIAGVVERITVDGNKVRLMINDTPVPMSAVREIGPYAGSGA